MPKQFSERSSTQETLRCFIPKGYTLIEVILSVVILVVGVIAVQRTLVGSLSALGMIENWNEAEGLLQGKIWEYERSAIEKPKNCKPTQQHGVLLGKNCTYLYDLSIHSIGGLKGSLMEGDIKLSWENMGMHHSILRVFYLRAVEEKNAK